MLHLLVPCVKDFCHVKTSRLDLIFDRATFHKQLIIALFTFVQSWMTHLPPIAGTLSHDSSTAYRLFLAPPFWQSGVHIALLLTSPSAL